MNWSKGFSAEYYMALVDPVTWADTGRIKITGGSISRSISGLRQSADIDCTEFSPDREVWVRVWLNAVQEGDVTHEALFTGLASVTESVFDGVLKTYPLSCYSVLKPAQDVLLDRGYYILYGTDAVQTITDLLSVSPAPVQTTGKSPKLSQTIIAEQNESHLSMVEKILLAIGWRMKIAGDGTIQIGPWDNSVCGTFGIYNDVIEPVVSLKADWFSCPNVFRATSGDMTAIARDDSASSLLSTVNRGREVWMAENNVTLSDTEGLEQYAKRRLQEEQSYAYIVSYDRRFDPNVNVTDVVRLHYPEHGLMDEYGVSYQHITLGHGATVSEEVQR